MNRQIDQWNRRESPVRFKCIWKFSMTLYTRINSRGSGIKMQKMKHTYLGVVKGFLTDLNPEVIKGKD